MANRNSDKNATAPSAKPSIWKISHGSGFRKNERLNFKNRNVAVVRCNKEAKQRLAFKTDIKKGDFFYLCYKGNRIILLGQFTSDAKPNPEKGGDWYERDYTVIKESENTSKYEGQQKAWAPNYFSACFPVKEEDKPLFEKEILQEYFKMSLADLYGGRPHLKPPSEQWSDPFQDPDPNPFQGGPPRETPEPYDKNEDFLKEVFMNEDQYDALVRLLECKKNIILQGPPGVGKTYAARRLAYSIMGKSDNNRIKFVQFHQSYSYEDFVEGHKPKKDGSFELQKGVFRKFCEEARRKERDYKNDTRNRDNWYFFIIDEINRGNTSKIFGELLMLIENDHRGDKTELAYSKEPFSVPENLYIIGMMNTADRSLAMIDYALRRRFSFFDIKPAFESDRFREYCGSLKFKDSEKEIFNELIYEWVVKTLNKMIADDKSLGAGFRIGHSYFCGWEKEEDLLQKMHDVVECDILPTLDEYWFDNRKKVWDAVEKLPRVLMPKDEKYYDQKKKSSQSVDTGEPVKSQN